MLAGNPTPPAPTELYCKQGNIAGCYPQRSSSHYVTCFYSNLICVAFSNRYIKRHNQHGQDDLSQHKNKKKFKKSQSDTKLITCPVASLPPKLVQERRLPQGLKINGCTSVLSQRAMFLPDSWS